jgi:hypothetical protein
MSIEKSHFFDQIGATLTSLRTLFELAGAIIWGGRRIWNFRHPSVRGILRPAKIGQEEVCMIGLGAFRSEQVRFVGAFLAVIVLAPKMLAAAFSRPAYCVLF